MRLHVMSDLHLDILNQYARNGFWDRLNDTERPGTLILAGDIASLSKNKVHILIESLNKFEDLYSQIFMVPGNHDFWGTSIKEGLQVLDTLKNKFLKITFLKPQNRVFKTSGVGFSIGGGTLWFPDCKKDYLKYSWSDYMNIKLSYYQIEQQHQDFLKQTDLPDIMVTHHFPTAQSIHPKWKNEETNCFFNANIGEWISKFEKLPNLWVHGHTHDPFDYINSMGLS